ncbi:non-ribosomal peptide synthetase/type I polyketide synthase [Streptomyces sp. NBC_00503]|uniref:non-ribosomal peptide synthetase/type I polyketide synthase n=1 Tax=Streptomyces sp. NBC_00503 TaxID=2903659 RepID=UPI002E81015E|nr:amino acid adenylation domain-containing protein [Streptomyces sp. NBC_00503]WUD86361.1 amino acid adenylation domain-containing protein [Streptomyces sp. NBC_00503]
MTDKDRERQNVLAQSVREIRRLREELDAVERARSEPIAIVGLACRMPGGAETPEEFWEFLSSGRDGIREVPEDRWDTSRHGSRLGGFLDRVDGFDAPFFGISPREAATLDPQQRLLLEVGWEALEHAGISPAGLTGTDTGVYFGVTTYDYVQSQMQQIDPADLEAYSLTSNASTFAAGRFSYWLGLQGPSLSVDTACSSSLVGVHLACQSLRSGETGMALAGGVNVLLSPEWFSIADKANMLAPDGHCKTFDSRADGYVRSEGCGVVVLKRLSDAQAAGDRVLGVIRGSAVNQDGRSGGITVPNAAAQQDVIRAALASARVEPAEIGYVEAHGTGTPLGDPLELRALDAVLGGRAPGEELVVGSVKSTIGHLEPAAGVAGLIKVVLSLQNEEIPAQLNLEEVNPEIGIEDLSITFPRTALAWPRGDKPRIAGVSSFGASGTNAHVVVEEAPADPAPAPTTGGEVGGERTAQLLALSAKSPAALADVAARHAAYLGGPDAAPLADVCHTAATGRAPLAHRLTVVAGSAEEMREKLAAYAPGTLPPAGARTGHVPGGARPKVAFLFTGQGSQYAGMGAGLYASEPVFRDAIDRCDAVVSELTDRSLLSVLHPEPDDTALVDETRWTQPALFAVEYALAELWRSWGIEPGAVLGHSIGEIVAACVAGVLSLEDALTLAVRRGGLMQELSVEGAMAAVFTTAERLAEALAPYEGELSVAAVNGPESLVVSGGARALDALLAELAAAGVKSKRLTVTRGFHSPLMDPVLDEFERTAAALTYAAPRIPVVSNVTGEPLTGPQAFSAGYLREHVRRPVDFLRGMTALHGLGFRIFVETGPQPALSGMAKRFVPGAGDGEQAPVFLPSLRKGHDDGRVALDSLGALYALGAPVDWAAYDAGRGRRRAALPTYPFQRTRHWFTPSARPVSAGPVAGESGSARLLGELVPSPLDSTQYSAVLDTTGHPCLGDCVMDGLPVVNIGVYLESALEAARADGGGAGALIEECLVLQSMILDEDQRARVQLVLDPAPGGRTAYRFYSARRDGAGWLLHSQGKLAPLPAGAPAATDLDALRAPLAEETTGEEFYRRMWRRKLYLGPTAQWIEHVWSGEGEAVARMRAPRPGEADGYRLHPGQTDALFQSLFACLPEGTPEDATFMLVGIDRFAFHGFSGAQGETYCRVRLLPSPDPQGMLLAEAALYDERGRTVVEATGVCLRRAAKDQLLRTEGSTPVLPVAAPLAPAAVPASLDAAGVRELLTATVARALGTSPDAVDQDEPLQNLGLDSLMALEVKDALSVALGVSLPLVAFLEGRSVSTLGDQVLETLGTPEEAPAGAGPEGAAPRPALTAGGDRLPELVRDEAARYEPFPLTDLQQAYLVGRSSAFELGNVSTYFFIEVDLDGVDVDRLQDSLRLMIDRHDMLRAVMTEDGYQRVLPEVAPYEIRTTDLRGCAEEERGARLAELHDEVAGQVFDTGVWPLFDIRATRVTEGRTRLHIGLDALIIDAWSTSTLFREWAAAYRGEAGALPEIPLTYREYVVTAKAVEETDLYATSLAYWRERIDTLPPAPELTLATDPGALEHPAFTHRSSRIGAEDWSRFKAYASAAGVTPSAALCTAYSQVLASWSKSSRFTLNVLFFNRLPLHEQVGSVLGNFSATTLLEIDSTASTAFGERAGRIQRQLWTDLEHSHVSGVAVLRELNRARGGNARANMPVVFASTVNFAAKEDSAASVGLAQHLTSIGEGGQEVSSSIRTPQVWLDHQVVEDAGALIVNWDVIEELFPAGMIDAMFDAYLDVLRGLCHEEDAWRRPAHALAPAAELDVRRSANATAGPLPTGLLHEPFAAQAAAHPERVAVIAPGRELTYGELDGHTDRLGRWLLEAGAGPGTFVGIVMEKGWEQVAATIGVLKSGAAYVPIDANVPAERLRLLLEKSGIRLVLTQSRVEADTSWPEGTVRLSVDGPGALAVPAGALPASAARPDDLAYVIFTSGSTGQPKGVMIEHTGALNTCLDINERFGITHEDRVLALSALNFDLSVYDVFGVLAAGGAIVLPAPDAHREPGRWAELVTAHGVTVWNSVPTLMEMFTEHALSAGMTGTLPLRTVMMSGDWIPLTLPERIATLAPEAAVWSLGGATEASIWSIAHRVTGPADPALTSVPYGKPLLNQQFHVLNEAMQPSPVWVPGQLYISGAGLARGYLGDEAKTRAAFLRHPATGERLYRTGDLGRYLPDGNIEFLGREDFQVKIQGYRIELGEIECALLACDSVRAAVVSAVGERQGSKRLVAYVVLDKDNGCEVTPELLAKTIATTLPSYMVPQYILILDELPLTANGKVDRSSLPVPGAEAADGDAAQAPRDLTESELASIWAEFFPDAGFGVHTDFFALGGNSLLAVRLMSEIRVRLDCWLPLSTLFARPTIALLATAIREAGGSVRRTALVPIRTGGTQTPLFFVHPVGGDVLCYGELASLLGEDQPFYALQVPDGEPLETVPELAAHYAAALTAAVPQGPYRLGGWSMGGVIALETARQLTAAGHEVEHLALIDLLEAPGPSPRLAEIDDAVLLSWFGRDLAGLAGTSWEPDPELFRAADCPEKAFEILYSEAAGLGVLPAGIGLEMFSEIYTRFARNFRALLAYAPQPYAGETAFLRAEDGSTDEAVAAWSHLFPSGFHYVALPGDHYSVMRSPLLRQLADQLSLWLAGTAARPLEGIQS